MGDLRAGGVSLVMGPTNRSEPGHRSAGGLCPVALALVVTLHVLLGGGRAAAEPPLGSQQLRAIQDLSRADRLLRKGRTKAAARLFEDVFTEHQGTQWAQYAELGLAWSWLAEGDLALAEQLLEDAAPGAGAATPPTNLLIGLLRAREGRHRSALDRLAILTVSTRSPDERLVGRLAEAYVKHWWEDYRGAAVSFDIVALQDSEGRLRDDALYGAAWSRWRAGDQGAAIAALERLVAEAPAGARFRSVPWTLVNLEPEAVFNESFRRYRREGAQGPERQLLLLLDSDGYSRARAALRFLEEPSSGASSSASPPVAFTTSSDEPGLPPGPVSLARPPHRPMERRADTEPELPWVSLGLAAGSLLAAALVWRSRQARKRSAPN